MKELRKGEFMCGNVLTICVGGPIGEIFLLTDGLHHIQTPPFLASSSSAKRHYFQMNVNP